MSQAAASAPAAPPQAAPEAPPAQSLCVLQTLALAQKQSKEDSGHERLSLYVAMLSPPPFRGLFRTEV
eukprot:6050636-Amphidinium_carterae.1